MPSFFHLIRLAGPLALITLLPSCSFFDTAKPPLKGERFSIFQEASLPKIDSQAKAPTSPEFVNSSLWPSLGGAGNHMPLPAVLADQPTLHQSIEFDAASAGTLNLMPPVVRGNLAYLLDKYNNLHAYNISTLNEVWDYRLPTASDHYVVGGLALDGDKIVATSSEGTVVMLDSASGKEIWKTKIEEPLRSAPAITPSGVLLVSKSNKLFSLSLDAGDVVWMHASPPESLSFLTNINPAIIDNKALALFSSGDLIMFRSDTGAELWQAKIEAQASKNELSFLADTLALPLLDAQFAFLYNQHQITAFDQRNGTQVWEAQLQGHLTPFATAAHLFLIDDRGHLLALEKATGKVVWSQTLPASAIGRFGPYVTSAGVLVFNDAQGLFFDLATGAPTKSFALDAPAINAPVIANGAIYLLDAKNNFAIYK